MNKIKSFLESEKGKDILIVIIVILVGLGSFELGRLSKTNNSAGIKIEYPDQAAQNSPGLVLGVEASKTSVSQNSSTGINSLGKKFFASSRGKKYYPVDCSAGQSIKESNRLWFSTREEAESAGFELSSSCL